MRSAQRTSGRVTLLASELRGRTGAAPASTTIIVPAQKIVVTLTTPDWTVDGALYYADVLHSLRSVEYVYQITDDLTGEDIFPERVNRRLDLDKLRIWLAYIPASVTVIIV